MKGASKWVINPRQSRMHSSLFTSPAWIVTPGTVALVRLSRLADAIADELAAFGGLVVVLDQRWPLTLQSGARLKVLDALQAHRRVTWFPHDEQADDWDASMSRLGALLRKRGVRCLVLGGLEAPPGVDTGCVNEVKRQLDAHGFVCRVDRALCGWYRDELAGGE